jgi:Flp pilus assembly protein TadG
MQDTTTPDEAGIAILELALTLPLVLAVIWGAISFGLVFTVDHTLSAAAAEGARAAVGTTSEAEAVVAAAQAATQQLEALGSHGANAVVASPSVDDCPAPVGARCITVHVTYPWGTAPIIPDLLGVITPDELTATSTVQLSQ